MKPRGYYRITPERIVNQFHAQEEDSKKEETCTLASQISPRERGLRWYPLQSGPSLNTKRKGYLFEKLLGRGSFGKVYLATDAHKEQFAIKVIDADTVTDTQREIKSLRQLSHYPECNRYIVCYYTSFTLIEMGKRCLYIVTEYLPGDTMEQYLQKCDNFGKTTTEQLSLTTQLLLGLSVIHNRGYAHRDIKPTNIMLTPNKHVKYIDFGLSCHRSCAGRPGTALYNPPEYYNGNSNDGLIAAQAHDVWSLGVVLYQLLMGARNYPFLDFKNKEQLIREIVERAPAYPPHFHLLNGPLKEVVYCMLIADWKTRPRIDDLVHMLTADIISLL